MRITSVFAVIVLLMVLGSFASSAETYRIDWGVISSGGGGGAGGAYKLDCTIGQPLAGYAKSASYQHWIGFWVPEGAPPTVVASTSEAKKLADGTTVSIAGRIASSGLGDFASFFYMQDADRTGGIRVAVPPIADLARGSVVNVIGTMGTTLADERQIEGPMVIIVSKTTSPNALGMPNRSLGGSNLEIPPLGQYGVTGGYGLNNVGLLVNAWGRVTEVGAGYVTLDDGSGPVRADTSTLASPPVLNSYVTVIGVSSLYKPGADRLRLLLPRGSGDVSAP